LDDKTLDIGRRLELFVDDYLVKEMKGLSLRLHSPTPEETVIQFDRPWEGPYSAYVTVMKNGDHFRMYYRGSGEGGWEVTCYAESRDGIEWTRPNLGLYPWNGDMENNIVWIGPGTHNFAPFKDENPNVPSNQLYKAIGGGPLFAFASPDGIHWRKMYDEPIITQGTFDSHNLAFWDTARERYVCYLRDYLRGIRGVRYSISRDFKDWTTPCWIDLGETPQEHLYTNGIIPYFRAPHIYLAFPKRFFPDRWAIKSNPEPGVSDAVFMSSRDGERWDRRFMEAFIRPGPDPNNWTHRSNMPAWGILQTDKKEISIYYSQYYFKSGCNLRRGSLRIDGFVSIHANYQGGEFVTHPLSFLGNELSINYATSACDLILVEVQDIEGTPIPGYILKECHQIYGDEVERIVSWRGGSNLGGFQSKGIRLRFLMRDADLYSLRFRP